MFDFDVVTGPSPAERAALERAHPSNAPAAPAALRPAEPAQRGVAQAEPPKPA